MLAGSQVPLDLTGNGRIRATPTDPAYAPPLSTLHMQGNTVTSFVNSTTTRLRGCLAAGGPNGSYDVESRSAIHTRHRLTSTRDQRRGHQGHQFPFSGTRPERPLQGCHRDRQVSDGFLTVDAIGGTNTKIDYITVDPTPTDPAPAKPTGLTATAGAGSVALSWTANPETDIKGYNVYRAPLQLCRPPRR